MEFKFSQPKPQAFLLWRLLVPVKTNSEGCGNAWFYLQMRVSATSSCFKTGKGVIRKIDPVFIQEKKRVKMQFEDSPLDLVSMVMVTILHRNLF